VVASLSSDSSKSDFTVQEGGKLQQIRSFDAEGGENSNIEEPKPPQLPVNTFTDTGATEDRGPLYILVYDMVNTDPEERASALKPLLDFVDGLPMGTRMALYVNSDGLHLLKGFTSDRARLHAALVVHGSGPHIPKRFMMGENFGKGDPLFTVRQLEILARNFQHIPGRKNLIWLCSDMLAALTDDLNHEHAESLDAGKEALAAMMPRNYRDISNV